ncbi:Uncharacterised protein [Yersinia frederiksenii]|nr:Uncharacterised protein [Yersinia frederiksenii]CNI08793.1 Uncharacterised protein [Yersinia frederiksenii]CNI21245.1 Uncharacterised protein [Yersinia frederiksenii]CNK96345.1 Uncharacterised protein [Yersinia frederiksenii]
MNNLKLKSELMLVASWQHQYRSESTYKIQRTDATP